MKICYINPTNNIRRPIAELAAILAEEGHTISIMYPSSKGCPTQNWVANQTIEQNGKIRLIPITSWYFAPLRYSFPNPVQLWKECKKAILENDEVHIWEYYYPLSIFPLLLSSLNKKNREKIVLTTDGFVGYSYQPKQPWWLTPAFKMYTQLVARLLFTIPKTITTYGKPMIPHAQKVGVPLSKLQVIPTGIHTSKYQNVDQKIVQKCKRDFNITNEKVILFVGMLTERKGVHKVIEVSQNLLGEGMNVKTLIVGDAHGKNKYKELVKPEYKEKIIFTGGRKDIPELMHLADVLLLPSEGEGLPGVVMEAMASGLSVVATREGCTTDLITSDEDGMLVADKNYVEAVKKILQNRELRERMAKQAKEKIQLFSWKKIASQYIQLYNHH